MKISEEVVFLENAFDILNQRFFESALSRPAITIQSTPRAYGHFTPYDAWKDDESKLKEINLGAESLHRPMPNIIATLMHEMVHYYCHMQGIKDTSRGGTYHNKRFKEEAEKRGLVISLSPRIGYSVTHPSSELEAFVETMNWNDELRLYRKPSFDSDCKNGGVYVDDDGVAHIQVKKPSSTRKYVCPKCGLSVRATKAVRIACVDCGNTPLEEETSKKRK